MRIEIDQSTKIEQSGPTILAFANGTTHAILIPSRVKHSAFQALRAKGKSKEVAHLLLFAACLYLLLDQHLHQLRKIVIDIEYPGKNVDIKAFLLRYIRRQIPDFEADKITFQLIGKKSPADFKARRVREKRDKNYRKIGSKELIKLIA